MRSRLAVLTAIMLALVAACSNDVGVRVGTASKLVPETTVAPTPAETQDTVVEPQSTIPAPVETVAPTPTDDEGGALDWSACGDAGDVAAPTVECGSVTVPFDYDDPAAGTIDIAVARVPASGDRVGAILVNPGGPGGSGLDMVFGLSTLADPIGPGVSESFDIIGFDPRGVDASGAIDCVDDQWLDTHLYADDTPDDEAEQALLDESNNGIRDGCIAALGDTARLYSTANTARDMDEIRKAIGDDQISYFGVSYGTALGATYATLFPDQTRAMVLDSAYSPVGEDSSLQIETQLAGFEQAFGNWATWCATTAGCGFAAADAAAVSARWDALYATLDATPLDVGGRPVNQVVLNGATIAALYSEEQWSILANSLALAEGGDGSGLLFLVDNYNSRDADGAYASINESFGVIECASGYSGEPPADPAAAVERIRAAAPRFTKSISTEWFSDDCPALVGDIDAVALSTTSAAPIMVIGGLNDPATPFRWAEKMTGELGASLATFTGEGHGVLLSSACLQEAAAALLVELAKPAVGLTCDATPDPDVPAWVADLVTPAELTPIASGLSAESLGLPAGTYLDSFASTLDETATSDAIVAAAEGAGWDIVSSGPSPVGDGIAQVAVSKGGDLIVSIIFGPAALADQPDFEALRYLVPPGASFVVRFSGA